MLQINLLKYMFCPLDTDAICLGTTGAVAHHDSLSTHLMPLMCICVTF